MDELRDGLKATLTEFQNQEPQEHSQPQTETSEVDDAASVMDGNTQTERTQANQIEYEIGGKKFNSWQDAKKWGDGLSSLYGKQSNELGTMKKRLEELEKSEAAQWMKDLQAHPKLAERIRNAYKDYNAELAGGATKKEAAQASGLDQLPPEIRDLVKWKEELVREVELEQHDEQIEKELQELKTAVPKLDDQTLDAVYEFAAQHTTLSLKQCYNVIVAEINAQKVASMKDTGGSGKFATVKTPPKKRDLTNEDEAKRNIAELLKG